jgi:hypothetical protein
MPATCGLTQFFNGARCASIRQCNNRQFISANATPTSDATCSFLRKCAPNEFEITPPTEYTNRVCAPRTACNPNTMYIAQEATRTSNAVCMPITVCQPGTKQTSPSGPRNDTTCEPCEAGSFSSSPGLKICKPFSVCSIIHYISVNGTSSSDRQCARFTTCSSSQYEVSAPIPRISNRVCGTCISCIDVTCQAIFMDVLLCPVIIGNRFISQSSATSLVNPVLTRAAGFLNINSNTMLTRVDFEALTFIGGFLAMQTNRFLTFAFLPRLSQVEERILFCENAHSFVIPNAASGTAAPPGLTSVQHKGQTCCPNCRLQQGSGVCGAFVICP